MRSRDEGYRSLDRHELAGPGFYDNPYAAMDRSRAFTTENPLLVAPGQVVPGLGLPVATSGVYGAYRPPRTYDDRLVPDYAIGAGFDYLP